MRHLFLRVARSQVARLMVGVALGAVAACASSEDGVLKATARGPAAGEPVPGEAGGIIPGGSNPGTPTSDGSGDSSNLPVSRLIGGATLDPKSFWPPLGEDCEANLDPAGVVPTTAPQALADACAGCHGGDGTGRPGYPSIVSGRTFAELQAIVRGGRKGAIGEMPAFDSRWVSDSDLKRIYAYLARAPIVETKSCTAAPKLTEAEIADATARGLAAWRTRDGHDDPKGIKTNVACANCHAPDALDFAYFGLRDGDILRRGTQHLPAAKIRDIVDMVHALRAKYSIGRRDPMQVRPFQPGGGMLPGKGIAARDLAFGTELTQMNLAFATKAITSAADADKALDEIWAIDRHSLRIPVPFNRYTEDGFHNVAGAPSCDDDIDGCEDHGTIADWIPVAPHIAKDEAAFYKASDAYLATPNDATMDHLRYIAAQGDMPGTYAYGTKDLDDNKYRSLMLANYCIRLEVTGQPGCYDKGVTPFPHKANIWDIGAQANLFGTGYAKWPDCNTKWASCAAAPANLPAWPSHALDNITPGATLSSNFSRLRHPWMTLWWTHFDPTLLVTGDPTAQKDEYFTRSLFWANENDWKFDNAKPEEIRPTYGIFAAYEVLMHNVATLKNPQLASCDVFPATDFACTAVDVRSGYYPNVINFAEQNQPQKPESSNNVHYQTLFMPTDGRRPTYQMVVANLYRVFFWKLIGSLQQDNWMCNTELQALRVERAKQFLASAETQTAHAADDAKMFDTLATLMAGARKECPALVK